MAATRRLTKELQDLIKTEIKQFKDVNANENNILIWTGLIVPDKAPYDTGAYRIQIDFPPEYPFKPPKITFKTSIYHPNIDERGQVCLPIISAENWKPATKTNQVIEALINLVNEPEPDHPLRADLAEEFVKEKRSSLKMSMNIIRLTAKSVPRKTSSYTNHDRQ